MKWHLKRVGSHWWAVGNFIHVFDSWHDAIAWIDTQRYTEPSA